MIPTIKIKAERLEVLAKLALKEIKTSADKKWNDAIEESEKSNNWFFWLLIGKWKVPNRESIERHYGKPDDGIMHWDTFYFKCYGDTTQTLMYKEFIKLGKFISTRNDFITLSIYDYNLLKSFED